VWTTISGDIIRVVLTPSFAARRVVFSTDGTLWAFGRVYDSKFEEQAEYDTLRQYDAEGKLMHTALHRSSFRASKDAPSSESYLAMSCDHIGVLSVGASEWIELSLTGQVIGRWPIQIPADIRITGAVLTSSNELFVSQERDTSNRALTATELITLIRFDKSKTELVEVDTTGLRSSSHQGLLLLGVEGDQLVIRIKPPWLLSWVRIK
jgi:hypothetical protein